MATASLRTPGQGLPSRPGADTGPGRTPPCGGRRARPWPFAQNPCFVEFGPGPLIARPRPELSRGGFPPSSPPHGGRRAGFPPPSPTKQGFCVVRALSPPGRPPPPSYARAGAGDRPGPRSPRRGPSPPGPAVRGRRRPGSLAALCPTGGCGPRTPGVCAARTSPYALPQSGA